MQRLEVSSAVRPIYGSLGVKRLTVVFGLNTFGQAENVGGFRTKRTHCVGTESNEV